MAGRTITETARLRLREFTEDDVQAYYALGRDPRVIRYTGAEILTSLEHALDDMRTRPIADYRRHGFGRWACVLQDGDQFIGWAGLKYLDDVDAVDLGYWLLPEFWGQGLATEAAIASVRHGFERLKLDYIVGFVDPANVASVRVLEKVGMRPAGTTEFKGCQYDKYEIHAPR